MPSKNRKKVVTPAGQESAPPPDRAHRPLNEEGTINRAKALEIIMAAWRENSEKGEVGADALAKALPTSPATAKKFIHEFDEVFRHVRASAVGSSLEWGGKSYYERAIGHNRALKQAIAEKFVELIPSAPSIACSAGTTVTYCVRAINDNNKPAHIVTNNLGVVREWSGVEEGLDLTGGTYDPDTNALSGEVVIQTFDLLKCSIGLLGVSGVTPGGGLFVKHRWEAKYRAAIVRTVVNEIYICTDAERLVSGDVWQFATIEEIAKQKPDCRVILITNDVQKLGELDKQGAANTTLNGLNEISARLGKHRFEVVVV